MDQERRDLEHAVEQARTPVDRATANLALANWHLAVPTTQPATKWLLKWLARRTANPTDAAAEAQNIKEACRNLEKLPASAPASGPASAPAAEVSPLARARQKLESTADALDAFAGVMASAVVTGKETEQKAARNAAARAVGNFREVDNPELAACALMWQAFTWNLAGREGRSTVILPNATVQPQQPSYDYLSRLIRCQIMADNRLYPTGVAMAQRVRSSCEEWFPKESPEKLRARERLAALVQCNIGNQWMAALRRDNFAQNADRLEAQLIQVQEAVFTGLKPPIAVYHLERSVPILVPFSKGGEASAKEESRPTAATKSAN
jgi:hypothetical protein